MAAKLLPLREMTVVYTSKELTKLSTVIEKTLLPDVADYSRTGSEAAFGPGERNL